VLNSTILQGPLDFDTVTTMMDDHGADHRIDAETQSFGPDDTLTVTSFNAP
jgi:hypothetical protein